MDSFEVAVRTIKDAVINSSASEEHINLVASLLRLTEDAYTLVRWPESQDLMEESWFRDEAILAIGSEEETGSSAYFIPIKRLI